MKKTLFATTLMVLLSAPAHAFFGTPSCPNISESNQVNTFCHQYSSQSACKTAVFKWDRYTVVGACSWCKKNGVVGCHARVDVRTP